MASNLEGTSPGITYNNQEKYCEPQLGKGTLTKNSDLFAHSLNTNREATIPMDALQKEVFFAQSNLEYSKSNKKTCKNCHKQFSKHLPRNGVSTVWLIIILLASIPIIFCLLLFLCVCETHQVCPKCGNFSGNPESNKNGICLC